MLLEVEWTLVFSAPTPQPGCNRELGYTKRLTETVGYEAKKLLEEYVSSPHTQSTAHVVLCCWNACLDIFLEMLYFIAVTMLALLSWDLTHDMHEVIYYSTV